MMNDASGPDICAVPLTIHLVLVLHDEEWIIIEVTEELDIGSNFHENWTKNFPASCKLTQFWALANEYYCSLDKRED